MNINKTAQNLIFNESVLENCSYFPLPTEPASTLSKASKVLDLIVPPVFLLIGIPGNILTITVILRQRKNITSTAVFLFLLAITDTVFLVIGTFVDWLSVVSGFKLRQVNSVMCKLTEFLYVTSAQFSSWLLIIITIERIISIIRPHSYRRLCSTVVSRVSGAVICFALAVLNSHFFYGFGNSEMYFHFYGSTCGPLDEEPYITFYMDYWPWIDLTILFAIPFVVLAVGNTVILFRLIQMHHANKKVSKNDKKNRRSIGSITLLIVGLNVVFLVSITPLAVFLTFEQAIYQWRDEVMCIDLSEFEYRSDTINLTVTLVLCLSYLNPSVNFILYVLSGSKFRNEIKALVFCKPVGKENAFS